MIEAEIQPGSSFGRLTVLNKAERSSRRTYWLCACQCGAQKVVRATELCGGSTKSCGCLRREKHFKHGHSSRSIKNCTLTYRIWTAMRRRCSDPNSTGYQYWGGRGITFCDRWREFDNFLADMGECPPGRSLDRINTNGNYEPDNCRWATRSEQNRNARSVKMTIRAVEEVRVLHADGWTSSDIAIRFGVSASCVRKIVAHKTWATEGQMRTFELKSGPVDVRYDAATDRFCLVYISDGLQLYRTMPREELEAFWDFIGKRLKETSDG